MTGDKSTLCRTGYTELDLYNPSRNINNFPLLSFACYGSLDAPDNIASGSHVAAREGFNGRHETVCRD